MTVSIDPATGPGLAAVEGAVGARPVAMSRTGAADRATAASLTSIVSCLSDYDADALAIAQAQRIIGDFIEPVTGVEKLAIRSALDRVLAQDVVSGIDVPAHDNSAMDGYALRGADLSGAALIELKLVGSVQAGLPFEQAVGPGECVRIMTGAVMPEGCDTVVPQELVHAVLARAIRITSDCVRPGENRRRRGEDLQQGQTALRAGKIVRAADLGLLASLGVPEVFVRRRVRVAFFSTGDELRSVGEPLGPGGVYDSNRYTLHGMLTRLGCDAIDMGVVRDDPDALRSALRDAAACADAVITSGGVSVGEADHTKQTMSELGDMLFWKIAMRPGRPMAFGRVGVEGRDAYLFGLPGNPVAVMVSFYFIVRDALQRLAGVTPAPLPRLRVRSQSAIRKRPGRTEYQRGQLEMQDDGEWSVRLTGAQGSGILRSMSDANCIVVLDHEQGNVAVGDQVQVVIFDGLI